MGHFCQFLWKLKKKDFCQKIGYILDTVNCSNLEMVSINLKLNFASEKWKILCNFFIKVYISHQIVYCMNLKKLSYFGKNCLKSPAEGAESAHKMIYSDT